MRLLPAEGSPALFATLLLAVAAAGPCDEPDARAFDFWVGEWNVNNRWRTDAGGWVDAGSATNQVFHVLDGCAVVELWDGFLGSAHLRGFSVRAWDPATRDWMLVLNWPRPAQPSFGVLRGTFRHGRGDFLSERTDSAGRTVLTRYTFSDITDRSLRWNDGTSTDGGRTWATRWIMEFTRRDPVTDPPLRNVPLAAPGRALLCPAQEARAFDPYLGEWSGDDVRLHSMAIVGECAILDQLAWRAEDGAWHEALFVRALTADGWEQYALDTVRRSFVRYSGAGPAGLALDGNEPAGAMHWSAPGDGATLTLTWTSAPTGPATWTMSRIR